MFSKLSVLCILHVFQEKKKKKEEPNMLPVFFLFSFFFLEHNTIFKNCKQTGPIFYGVLRKNLQLVIQVL